MAKKKNRRKSSWPLVLMVIGGLIILGAAGWYAGRLAAPTPTPGTLPVQAENTQEIARVSLPDAKAAFDQDAAIFLDVRDAGSYASSHIPGALSIPLNELPDRLGELDQNAWIITYCT